jgi:hypothetical protein
MPMQDSQFHRCFSNLFELRRVPGERAFAAGCDERPADNTRMTSLHSRPANPICRPLIFRPIDLVPAFHGVADVYLQNLDTQGEMLLAETQRNQL